ncbi:MAG: glycosyltransferase family 9 protein [Candidatus Margulisiibacteriota bacterium]
MKIDKEKIKKILLIRPEMIGDYVIITPAIALLKQAFPWAIIAIFIKPFTRALAQLNTEIDEIITDPKQIKTGNYDLSIDFYGEPKYALLALRAGIKYRVGDASRLFSSLFYNLKVFINWKDFTKHYLEHYCELLRPLGIDISAPHLHLQPNAAAIEELAKIIPDGAFSRPVVGLHIGTGGSNRAWTAENFAKTADLILSQGIAQVILLGGEKETAKAQQILALCHIQPINLVNKLTLPQLVALISKLNVYVGTDTGPLHMAAAIKVPVAALMVTKFVKPTQWGPWETRNLILRPPHPCDKICNPRTCTDPACMDKITPEDVLAAVKILLSGGGNQTLSQGKTDWLKKSLRILLVTTQSTPQSSNQGTVQNISQALTAEGFDIRVCPNLSFFKLVNYLVAQDINLVHYLGGGSSIFLRLACALAGLKTNFPVLFFQSQQKFNNAQAIVEYYLKHI